MAEEFNSSARDGDGDGIVQDGTEFERPIEELLVAPSEPEEVVEEVVVEEAPKAEEEEDSSFVINSDSSPKPKKPTPKKALAPVADGVIGSGGSDSPMPKPQKAKPVNDADAVGIYSTRNIRWENVGQVWRGYNIVSKSDSEKWLERPQIRVATPEEIAREFKS
tara:strand:+ start:7903 stop:8394 length:492 start_codon:yes stop_codon:yes gene_type:complete